MSTLTMRPMLWLIILTGALVATVTVAWLLDANPLAPGNVSGDIHGAIEPWRHLLMIARWMLWCVVWMQWQRIGEQLLSIAESKQPQSLSIQWKGMRGRMFLGIAVVEAIILFNAVTGV